MASNVASSQVDRLNKLREERIAREKARIEKLREMNLKKYNKPELQTSLKQSASSVSVSNRSTKSDTSQNFNKNTASVATKNNINHNNITKRPITAPVAFKKPIDSKNNTSKNATNKNVNKLVSSNKVEAKPSNNDKRPIKNDNKIASPNEIEGKQNNDMALNKNDKIASPNKIESKPSNNGKVLNKNGDKIASPNKNEVKPANNDKAPIKNNKLTNGQVAVPKVNAKVSKTKSLGITKEVTNKISKDTVVSRKSMAPSNKMTLPKPNVNARKSLQPPKTQTTQNSQQSVFERLYKPKFVHTESVDNAEKLRTNPNFLKKVIRESNLILNKRHTVFETKTSKTVSQPVRRSISAVHFKRISKNELSNCIHKWASIGEKLNKVNLKDVNEDDGVKGEVVVSAVKSERKRVKFQTPVPFNFNTPKPEELQSRLQSWLQKRGKSLDSFHHLQCFGIHHLTKNIKPLNLEPPKFDLYDDENKENVPLESDSDDDSYTENMNKQKDKLEDDNKVDFNKDEWRSASYVSDSATDYNESTDTITSNEVMHHVDELLLGALNDLTQLLKEGFDWEQCARWLRAIRDRFPSAPDNAAYWECRAALEERRGDLPASVECWEEAIAMGSEHSVVEANLDQLLDKFLQLRISPNSGRRRQADPKMLDVKNVFKSTIIRFAVQQAKLRQSNQSEQSQPKFTVTPVRRSGRLSMHARAQTPLRICATLKQACELGPVEFKPNRTLTQTP